MRQTTTAQSPSTVAAGAPNDTDGSLKTLDDVVTIYFSGIIETGSDGSTPDSSALPGQSF